MNCTNCGKFISITGKWEMLALFKKNQWHCTSRNGKVICCWFVCSTLTKYTQWRMLEISPNLPCFVSPPQMTIKSSFLPKLQRMRCYVVKYNYCWWKFGDPCKAAVRNDSNVNLSIDSSRWQTRAFPITSVDCYPTEVGGMLSPVARVKRQM